ncbi:MAG TPA: hypothetical protein VGP99_03580 [Tepidisphaeraceae bacterium]|jgi:hypothetical protein|nr:hypothetical protein [Tepidisphaeraceae bacterium]
MLTSRPLCALVALLLVPIVANAQQSRPAGATALTATITAIEGIVQVRPGEDAPWQKATVGMKVGEGAEFRTGPRSAVRFEIPPDQIVTLDRLGTVKLIEAIQRQESVKTDLGMKYGRVRYDVEAAGLPHDSTIHSPGSALAVRGTQVSYYDQPPFAPQATSLTGRAAFRNNKRQMVRFGGKAKATVAADTVSPAQAALVDSILQIPDFQHNEQQIRELRFLFSHSGSVFGNVATSTVPVSNAELPALLGGRLDFVLRWDQPEAADLNLFVRSPLAETFGNPPFILSLFPGNKEVGQFLATTFPQSSPSGGSVGLNHIGPAGIEIASWGKRPPDGLYVVGAYNFIYSETPIDTTGLPKVGFKLEAFLNGKRQQLLLNLEEAVAGTEPPRFGPVFKDSIAVTELAATAVQITTTGAAPINPGKSLRQNPPAPTAKPTARITPAPMQRRP